MTKVYVGTITDSQIRRMHNGYRDGTANDAIGRHLCKVALGECCIADDTIPGGWRYPDDDEIRTAKSRLCRSLNERNR